MTAVTSKATAAVRAVDVWKTYGGGDAAVTALRGVSVGIQPGRFVAIMGPSSSGKPTLMHCLAGLDTVSRGEVYVGETRLNGLSDRGLTRLRRDKVGFVFQQFNLLPTLTALENITLPLAIAGRRPDADWLTHRPSELSGGRDRARVSASAHQSRILGE